MCQKKKKKKKKKNVAATKKCIRSSNKMQYPSINCPLKRLLREESNDNYQENKMVCVRNGQTVVKNGNSIPKYKVNDHKICKYQNEGHIL